VHKVKFQKNEKIYAMKITELKNFKPSTMDLLKQEGSLMLNLSHPNILMCYASFMEKDTQFLVLEYAQKGDLHNLII
jgi:serine/threonine protein kinase